MTPLASSLASSLLARLLIPFPLTFHILVQPITQTPSSPRRHSFLPALTGRRRQMPSPPSALSPASLLRPSSRVFGLCEMLPLVKARRVLAGLRSTSNRLSLVPMIEARHARRRVGPPSLVGSHICRNILHPPTVAQSRCPSHFLSSPHPTTPTPSSNVRFPHVRATSDSRGTPRRRSTHNLRAVGAQSQT